MDRSMVSAAQGEQVVGFVLTALGAGLDVVDVEKAAVPAAGHAAAAVVTEENGAPKSRRDRLAGARGLVGVCFAMSVHVGVGTRIGIDARVGVPTAGHGLSVQVI